MPVYLIQAGETEFVKIGWAVNPEKRLRDLQCAHYEPLHIIRVLDGAVGTESWLHRRFAALRVRSEWFRFVPEMLTIKPIGPIPVDGNPIDTDPILLEVENFLQTSGMTSTAFGEMALSDPTLVHELRNGRECRRATRIRIREFIAAGAAA